MRLAPRFALVPALACAWLAVPAAASHGRHAAAASPPADVAPAQRDWSEPADFEALRAEYAARRDFAQLCEEGRPLSVAIELMQAERWSELLALSGPWAERCPVDMEAHMLRSMALGKLGRADEANDAEMWARGLFEAALASGDGTTPQTAYRVLGEFEEYSLLRAFRYSPQRQVAAPDGDDALIALADGEEKTFYFARVAPVSRVAAAIDARPATN